MPDRESRREFLKAAAGVGVAAGLAASPELRIVANEPEPETTVPASRNPAPRKKVIAWGRIDWYSPAKVQMNMLVNYALQLEGSAKGPPTYLTPQDRLQLFEHNVYYALTTADEYVWCYGERISWWEKESTVALPNGALEAIRSARAKFEQNQPLGFDMTERIAAARKAELEARK